MKVVGRTLKMLFLIAGCVALLFLFVASVFLGQIPSDKEIRSCLTTKLYQVKLCPGSSSYVKYSQISQYLVKAVVLTEDSSFWQHNGFDFGELQKSLETNLKKGRYARGGSTITQQLAKNLFLTKEKTMTRKGLEAVITLRLERVLTKKEILERYLNVVQFGKDLYGVKAAAQFYFQKSPSQLDVVESAFLAFLLPSPENYSKSFFRKQLTPFARARLNQIVERLYEYERINGDEYETARAKIAHLWGPPPATIEEDPAVEAIDEERIEQQIQEFGEELEPTTEN
ncbi:MAG: monofunctional biosynthetic peptidoglycan transglycosylase [Bdellovibrionaceae bacterium]|nr:monofunctional biosynthetic peptidoglycan transglycosylase [Pseudobdellovibrionaceae bacterium]